MLLASSLARSWYIHPVTPRVRPVGVRERMICGFGHFVNRRNRVSLSFSDPTDWKLAGPSSQSTPDTGPHTGPLHTIQQPRREQGGCRGTVVGAVVEIEKIDVVDGEGGMRARCVASSERLRLLACKLLCMQGNVCSGCIRWSVACTQRRPSLSHLCKHVI